ncbi:Phosphoglucomutase-3, partial [Bachmanniomyces sp. S44760]|nr:Phosphoglucomutase-3 [Bachmanniomyces sp. S44760]
IEFGTAGLRARMEAGFAGMNSLIVIQTSQGLAEYSLLGKSPDGAREVKQRGVVIGFDARYNSERFARLAAAAFMAKGFHVWYYETMVHTPMVPFAVKALGAVAGVMITASHNPKDDNGYKVYGPNGCQIKPPADGLISDLILQNLDPITWHTDHNRANPMFHSIKDTIAHEYYSRVADLVNHDFDSLPMPRFCYTPLHGVGLKCMFAALWAVWPDGLGGRDSTEKERFKANFDVLARHARVSIRGSLQEEPQPAPFGLGPMSTVSEQALPDPEFPTVKYPNPEENGALFLAYQEADRKSIGLVLANDPDADRLAVAERVNDTWVQFSGDQLGVLLGYRMFERHRDNKDIVMLISAVSSQMLAEIGKVEGFHVEACLTGFKWLGNRALDLGKNAIYAYEEAQGYMFPHVVHDKDGITAAMVFLEACAVWGSPWEKLKALYQKYGFYENRNTYWRSSDELLTSRVFERIRHGPEFRRLHMANRNIYRWRDLARGYDSAAPDQIATLPSSPSTQMITIWLRNHLHFDEGVRITIRCSGTEPKIKGA